MATDRITITPERLAGHNGSIYALAADPSQQDGFYSAGGEGWIVRWPWLGSPDGKLAAEVGQQVFSLACVPDSRVLVAGTMDGHLFFVDLDRPEEVANVVVHQRGIFAILPNRDRLITAGGDGKLVLWNLATRKPEQTIRISHDRLRSLAFSPDQKVLAIGSSDKNIYLFHTETWKLIDVIEDAHDSSVFGLTFSADGQQLISGGRDAHLKCWNLADGFSLVQDLSAHWFTINALALDPTGRLLASASRDKTIRLWRMPDFTLLKVLDNKLPESHINSVNDLTWSPDGKVLVSASDDRTLIRWQIEYEQP